MPKDRETVALQSIDRLYAREHLDFLEHFLVFKLIAIIFSQLDPCMGALRAEVNRCVYQLRKKVGKTSNSDQNS